MKKKTSPIGMQLNEIGRRRMNFCEALKEMMNGRFVYRRGWNGEEQFVSIMHMNIDGEVFPSFFLTVVDVKGDNDKIYPWHPSPTDLLAEDWEII